MAFFQAPPVLGNVYDDDGLLREYHARVLPSEISRALGDTFRELGALSGGELYQAMLANQHDEPRLIQWDAWGHRIDHIEVSSLWQRAQKLAAEHGLVARGYDEKLGPFRRVVQFSLNYLLQPSLDVYSCPLAMTDGAARTLIDLGATPLVERALPHLISTDPSTMWTSGQWMTERTGGSDVGLSETVARRSDDGQWRLYGTKWFTSATTSEMALTLARPEGNPGGGRGLALFYVETRDAHGHLNQIAINRLKDKLGTRKVPTAELTLDGTIATPVKGLSDGVRNITPMLTLTRTWNSAAAAWSARRALALAEAYARARVAFGAPLAEKPLHVDTLEEMAAETEATFHLAFWLTELLGRIEDGQGTDDDRATLRILTPIAKLTTAKQAVSVTSEAIESFGGAGYVEDTGLPRLLADAQVLPIWEGTTNVLSLDVLRALTKDEGNSFRTLGNEISRRLDAIKDPSLRRAVESGRAGLEHARNWLMRTQPDLGALEAGARRFALTLGRTTALSLLLEHADECVRQGQNSAKSSSSSNSSNFVGFVGSPNRAVNSALRYAMRGVDLIR
ncbi:MAG: acyl-CoA dehydrogenase family protein [Deltaproteobacteria bacterium]|nr:acyl-CoA dehydrogenase family protein [Deltaproteobacteria bacterium]